jgi:proteasome assembly chaperone (PAC2) family protein
MKEPLEFSWQPEPQNSSLIVGWGSDAGRLGEAVTDYIIERLDGRFFYEIDPSKYFSLGGVTIEDDLVQFPESKFYACNKHNLVIFKSAPPTFEAYKFVNQILDIAVRYCKVKEIYSIGGMVSPGMHTVSRQLIGTFSSTRFKEELGSYGLENNLNYETPTGQKPTLNSFLLWITRRRNLTGVNIWTPVPFYLMSVDDPKSQKRVHEFFNQRFKLGMDLSEFDENIKKQNMKINQLRNTNSEIDDCLIRLESNLRLTEDENMKLVKQVEEYLKDRRN